MNIKKNWNAILCQTDQTPMNVEKDIYQMTTEEFHSPNP